MIDRCAECGHPRAEHTYNGACYGLCGEFVPPRSEVRSESARAEDIAIELCLSYGRDPDEPTSIMEMCDGDNQPVPTWMVYAEQAEALLAKFDIRRAGGVAQAPGQRPVANIALLAHIADQKRRYQTVILSHEQADLVIPLLNGERISPAAMDALIDQVAAMPCKIDCTGKTQPTLSDQLVQIARGIQKQRKASSVPSAQPRYPPTRKYLGGCLNCGDPIVEEGFCPTCIEIGCSHPITRCAVPVCTCRPGECLFPSASRGTEA